MARRCVFYLLSVCCLSVCWLGAASASDEPHAEYVSAIMEQLETSVRRRVTSLLAGTRTKSCRDLVSARFTEVYTRLLREDWLPFEAEQFRSDCDGGPNNKAPERSLPKLEASKIRLAYLLLVHESPEQVVRLVDALTEEPERHSFAIHVDGKAEDTYRFLETELRDRPRVRLSDARTNVSWGGFNVVRATLFGLEVILDAFDGEFDWVVTVSGYHYPLASNVHIRETLAKFPADTEFMEIRPKPNDPMARAWHQFVECDDAMRRIYRLAPPRGIHMYMGSQWMMITRDFARYVVGDPDRRRRRRAHLEDDEIYAAAARPSDSRSHPGGGGGFGQQQKATTTTFANNKKKNDDDKESFAEQYERYGQYTMVADENYFVTVLKNSPFCRKHHNDNFLHVQFDQWENEKASGPAQNKCLQPNPKHCGRSPTTLTLEYLPVLELGGALFARKFDPNREVAVIDALDRKRQLEVLDNYTAPTPPTYVEVTLVFFQQQEEEEEAPPLCVQVSDVPTSKVLREVELAPCDDAEPAQLFDLGPCSTDGAIEVRDGEPAKVTPGIFAPAPFCPIHAAHLVAEPSKLPAQGLCLDLEREQITAGTNIIAYACSGRWNQLFGFGTGANGKPQPGAVYVNVPYAHHDPKELCLEIIPPHDDVALHTLKVNRCDPANKKQVFHFQYRRRRADDDDDDTTASASAAPEGQSNPATSQHDTSAPKPPPPPTQQQQQGPPPREDDSSEL